MDQTEDDAPPEPRYDPKRGVGNHATWRATDLVFCALSVIFVLFVVLAIAESFIAVGGWDTESMQANRARALATGIWEASIVLVVFFFVHRRGGNRRNLGLVNPDGTGDTIKMTPGSFVGTVLASYMIATILVVGYQIVVDALGFDGLLPDEQIPDEYFQDNATLVILAISTTLLAPFAEELLFRGFLYGGLRRYMPVLPAALISGLCFSSAHGQLGLILPFAAVGMLFAIVYERTRTLYAAIGVHLVFNAVSTTVLILTQRT